MAHALERMGRPVPAGERAWLIGPSIRAIYAQALGTESREEIDTAIALFRERYAQVGVETTDLYPGARELLERLKADGRRLAIASLKARVFIERIVERLGGARLFESVRGTPLDDPSASKEAMLAEALAEDGVRGANDVVMIGDTASDILAARHCGVWSVAALYGYGDREELMSARPTAHCEDMAGLAAVLSPRSAVANE